MIEIRIRISLLELDPRACPGCMFPDAPEGKWPHVTDGRCFLRSVNINALMNEMCAKPWGKESA